MFKLGELPQDYTFISEGFQWVSRNFCNILWKKKSKNAYGYFKKILKISLISWTESLQVNFIFRNIANTSFLFFRFALSNALQLVNSDEERERERERRILACF